MNGAVRAYGWPRSMLGRPRKAILHGSISSLSVPGFLPLPNTTVVGGGGLEFAMFSRFLKICKSHRAPEASNPPELATAKAE